jgi:hypothetical protein
VKDFISYISIPFFVHIFSDVVMIRGFPFAAGSLDSWKGKSLKLVMNSLEERPEHGVMGSFK